MLKTFFRGLLYILEFFQARLLALFVFLNKSISQDNFLIAGKNKTLVINRCQGVPVIRVFCPSPALLPSPKHLHKYYSLFSSVSSKPVEGTVGQVEVGQAYLSVGLGLNIGVILPHFALFLGLLYDLAVG